MVMLTSPDVEFITTLHLLLLDGLQNGTVQIVTLLLLYSAIIFASM